MAVLGNMLPAPFCRSAEAALAPAAEFAEDAAELGAPAASLEAGVDRRLAHDLGFWGAGAGAATGEDSGCSAWAPFTLASSLSAFSDFAASPPSLVGGLASLELGRGTAGIIGRAGAAVREDVLVASVEAGLVSEGAGREEVGVDGVVDVVSG